LFIKVLFVEQQAQRSRKQRRSKAQIIEMLDRFEKSGITVTAFCKQYKVGTKSFYRWQNRYGTASVQADKVGFATVDIAIDSSAALFAEVKGIKIFQAVSPSFLKELLQ
jgi:hypothetical protein